MQLIYIGHFVVSLHFFTVLFMKGTIMWLIPRAHERVVFCLQIMGKGTISTRFATGLCHVGIRDCLTLGTRRYE
jgi:hypothetical protein